ncbi:MAG: GNAT family N-acetyltransferase [Verrucomicrobia bacterium]|nr:GNAT family N-acetyltransferase [Verrucomicrobiota bacterium]
MNIEYRLAGLEDIPELERQGQELFDYPVKPNRAAEFISDERHHLMLAYVEKSLVGMVSAFHYVHPDKDASLYINEVSVLDSYQNKGIGRKLMQLICSHARSLGCVEAWVATKISNISARRAFIAAGGREDDEGFVSITFEV